MKKKGHRGLQMLSRPHDDSNCKMFSRTYKLESVNVCREMFVKSLQISTKRVHTAVTKFKSENVVDLRGNSGGLNKTPEEKIQSVIDHISKIPKYTSHYCRNVTEAKYLQPDMMMAKMYALYKEEVKDPVSLSKYKHVFYTKFNLKRKRLQKDTCNVCDRLKVKISVSNGEEKDNLQQQLNAHHNLQKKARDIMKEDIQRAKTVTFLETITFDMEKTLPLPRIPTNIVFYKRQLWLYNTGVHSAQTNIGYCYIWIEGQAGKGAQEIGSSLIKHIRENVSSQVKELIMWCDSCGGQNRNIKMVLILKTILENSETLQKITIKFLVSGHSFLMNDSDFSDIEKSLKAQQRLYTPEDYMNVMRNCRRKNPLRVRTLKKEDFVSTKELEKRIVNRKKYINGVKINWLKIREIQLRKNETYKIFTKEDFAQENYNIVNIEKNISTRHSQQGGLLSSSLTQLWPNGKAVSTAKLNDLQSLMHLIPADARPFYILQGSDNVLDDVDGLNTDIDFEINTEEVD